MNDSQLPIVKQFTYTDFAILLATVEHSSPLDGNSGDSSVRFNVQGGSIWLGTEERDSESQRDFTIQLSGTSEHQILARAFREIADQLDAAPVRGQAG
ncbi:hypothetical protein SAMN06295974_1938 [Plantibacter flavus]|uniref:Uncharacterized protein n=1 Tax=Plantibacter flavus TaxID=150123 RepID=A0A1S7BDM6_9MICO|nr:hypothetical protein [Plantibacter flavus]AQX81786.1 hypothetical protein BWO91_19135 [Plantibacter flavus]ROR80043.1 hypothetical protein EDD42_0075 [Plantibacter flavus]SMG28979.1 hypothetical protein SAMN06295974_1938 [Plantibacter flavus]